MLKRNDDDLREFRAKLPKAVRDLLPRDLAGMEDDTRKMQSVAARLNAEADLLLAASRLRKQQGETVDASELREQLAAERRRADSLEVQGREKDEAIMRLKSIPAQAVHS